MALGCTRRGGSGALNPRSAICGAEFLPRAFSFVVRAFPEGDEGRVLKARPFSKPRQVRKEATVRSEGSVLSKPGWSWKGRIACWKGNSEGGCAAESL